MITLKSKSTNNDHSVSCKGCGEECWVTNINESTDWLCWFCNAYVVTVIGTDKAHDDHIDKLWLRMYALPKIETMEK